MMKSHVNKSLLIFTDLDGSLLDHDTYRHDQADSILIKLEERSVPVIMASSKTKAELLYIREQLNNRHPFIVENGAAIFIPAGYFKKQPTDTEAVGDFWLKNFVRPRDYWLSLLARTTIPSEKFTTFIESSLTEIVSMTGLDHDSAGRAAHRHYGEPVLWQGNETEKQQFIRELEQLGANVLQGGRFIHVSGQCDKSTAMQWLTKQYINNSNFQYTTLAIGDSLNDVNMLKTADIALLIPSPAHNLPHIEGKSHLYIAPQTGPSGWSEGVTYILQTLDALTAK